MDAIKRRFALVLLALVGSIAAQPAAARWGIEIEGGAVVPLDKVKVDDGGVSVNTDVDAGGSFGLGGLYGLGDYVDLTGNFRGNFAGVEIGSDYFYAISLTAGGRIFLLPPHRVRPWVGAELGWYRAQAKVGELFGRSATSTDDSFGINAGGGIDVAVSRTVSLGVDIRYHNAFDALDGLEFLTTMLKVGIHFGGDRESRFRSIGSGSPESE